MFVTPGQTSRAAIRETLSRAACIPFYRDRWAQLPSSKPPTRLSDLPFLDKTTAAEAQETLRAEAIGPQVGIVSSATTRTGRPLRVLRSDTPQEAPGRAVHTIRVLSPRHGAMRPTARGELVLFATLHDNTVDVLVDLLVEHSPEALVIPLSTLKWVTVALERRGDDPSRLGLGVIGTTGYLVTPSARRFIEPAWRAPILDNWSMSELEGYAHPCQACGYTHWQGAPTWFELLDPSSLARAKGDFGELVATTLYPHGAAMPLIRYRTGDLVTRGPECSAALGRRGMRFLGRLSTSAVRDGRPLALSGPLQELGESLPDVAQVLHPAERLGLIPPSDIGVPKIRLHGEDAWVLDVELRYDPRRFGTRAAEVKTRFEAAVDPSVRVQLHAPGALELDRLARKL